MNLNDTTINVDIKELEEHIKSVHKTYKAEMKDGQYYADVKDAFEPTREELQNLQKRELNVEQVISTFLPDKKRSDFEADNEEFVKNLFDLLNVLTLNPFVNDDELEKVLFTLIDEENVPFESEENKEWFELLALSLINCKTTNNALAILSRNSVDIDTTLERLHDNLLFLRDAVNLVIGESKSGKTYTTCKSLVDNGFKDQIIHIDFDRNSDDKLRRLGIKTYHIVDATSLMNDLKRSEVKNELLGKILVIDSLQDLSTLDGLDTMNNVLAFRDTGATVIVIHHTTIDGQGKFKVKGNATTITSKCDTTISFVREKDKRTYTIVNTRAEDKIPSGTKLTYVGEEAKGKPSSKKEVSDEPPK